MDLPKRGDPAEVERWQTNRQRVVDIMEEYGLRYFRGGQVLPNGAAPPTDQQRRHESPDAGPTKPTSIQELVSLLVRGLPRAMHPLTHRRANATPLTFHSEYDIQDLLHAMLRPWVADIRPEEFTPSYAGSSTRMDLLLPAHRMVLELKLVRDRSHGKKFGDELIVDIEHYRKHPQCDSLWCVVYDPSHYMANAPGLVTDLEGKRSTPEGTVDVRVMVVST